MVKSKPFFQPVESKVDFPSMEKRILSKWSKNGVVNKYLTKNKSSNKTFSFLDGPITANNPMGVHHAWGRTYKDLWQRYKNMRGFKQRFQNGFDCQGLWVEVEVEKELGFRSKKDIENYGIEKFVEKCKQRVEKYAKVQTEQSKRLGYFMDWDNSYYTMSDDNNYMIWHFLKVCHDNNWLYKGKDSVPWCPRCETAISQHEILSEDYKEMVHDSIYFKLPLVDKENEFLLVWTTTPWTLPANVAVAVDKNLEYSLIKISDGCSLWIARETLKRVLGNSDKKVITTVKGKDLIGFKYNWAFDGLERVEDARGGNEQLFHSVVETDERILPISTDEGTGMVHVATGAGTEDFALGKKLGLPILDVIKDDASYLDDLGEFSGKNAKDKPEIILDYLGNLSEKTGINWVFNIHRYKHRYPACWRCKEELVWKVTDEWYIAMDKGNPTLRERMKKVANKMNWIPEFGLKRELDWLENMHDWLISKKNRYWGLALPIWECKECGYFEVIGSKEELKKKVVEGWGKFEGKSPHKPQIDELKLKCDKCGKQVSRIEPVGNPWLDAGIVAYSTISVNNKSRPLYLTDKQKWNKWFPADFITESFPGQFKNWFYSLIAMSTVLEDREPAKTVLGFATLFAEDGQPMHKSTGNMIEFNEAADKIGVDVMRWMYLRQNYSDNLLFGYRKADDVRRSFHLMFWNIYKFFITYANLDNWIPEKKLKFEIDKLSVLDLWILQRLKQVIIGVTQSLEEYDAKLACELFEEFVKDLSLWYIRRSRERVGPTSEDKQDKEFFYQTTYFILTTLSQLLAPFTPFLADEIFSNLASQKYGAVHLSDWPDMNNLKMSTKTIRIFLDNIEKMDLVRKIVERGHAERKIINIPVRQPLAKIEVKSNKKDPGINFIKLILDELNIKKVIWKLDKSTDEIKVKLDINLNTQLKEEAQVRELIRKIQNERKILGLNLLHKTKIVNNWIPKDKKMVEKILQKTSSVTIEKGKLFKVIKI